MGTPIPEPRAGGEGAVKASRRVSRRTFLRLAGVTGLAAGLATGLGGCGGLGRVLPQSERRPVQLVYQDWRTEWFPPMVQTMLDEFHKDHPNIRVFYTPDPESEVFDQAMSEDFVAGTAPDVFQGCCQLFPAWAQKGYALDLRPFIEADLDDETIGDWDPVQYAALSLPGGLQYGVPKYRGSLALYFNKALFDAAGLAYPGYDWTYDDYEAAMRRLSRDTDGDGRRDIWGSMFDPQWDRLQTHANAWGGHFVDPEDSSRSGFDSRPTRAALEWLRQRMWDDRVMAAGQDVGRLSPARAFASGRVAMVEEGSWALKEILSAADFRVGVAPLPEGPARRVSLAGSDGFGIYSGTAHPEEAWELVKFLISKQYGRAMARANFLQPARLSLAGDWVQAVQEQFPGRTGGLDLSVFADSQRRGYSVTAEIFPERMGDVVRLATEVFNRLYLLGEGSTEELVELDRRIEDVLAGREA
jgi:multiple sugar transport system substrate-binding protein